MWKVFLYLSKMFSLRCSVMVHLSAPLICLRQWPVPRASEYKHSTYNQLKRKLGHAGKLLLNSTIIPVMKPRVLHIWGHLVSLSIEAFKESLCLSVNGSLIRIRLHYYIPSLNKHFHFSENFILCVKRSIAILEFILPNNSLISSKRSSIFCTNYKKREITHPMIVKPSTVVAWHWYIYFC